MTNEMTDKNVFIDKVDQILNGESNYFVNTCEQLNKCIGHIYQLICDAYTLYINDAYTSSVFLSIAVIEEVGKVHMGMYINASELYVKKDRLRDHKTKEIAGTSYTICKGERINKAISPEKIDEIFQLAYSGKLKELREQAIYCECRDGNIVVPNDIINQEFSKNILLFAIESFDDNLVGYTSYSMEISKKTDFIFAEVTKQ